MSPRPLVLLLTLGACVQQGTLGSDERGDSAGGSEGSTEGSTQGSDTATSGGDSGETAGADPQGTCDAPNTLRPYEDAGQWVAPGRRSHWAQPWRAYLETVPASVYLRGIGAGFNYNGPRPDLIVEMLARHGVTNARMEIEWGRVQFDDRQFGEGTASRWGPVIDACRDHGVRPMVMLNAHHGGPCPMANGSLELVEATAAGTREIRVTDTTGVEVGRTGLNGVVNGVAAGILVTDIQGDRLTLSGPLPDAMGAGEQIDTSTLAYRPFSVPGSPDYEATMAGWRSYLDEVSRFVSGRLGTQDSNDLGFDLEVWNVLRFGERFLYINRYYDPALASYDETSIHHNLVASTGSHAADNPAFSGVEIADGFANESSIPASSTTPPRVAALGKHQWPPRRNYPAEADGTWTNRQGATDDWQPAYAAWFPEQLATGLEDEGLIYDLAPTETVIGGVTHGRLARKVDGETTSTPVWVTELALRPTDAQPDITPERAAWLKAKGYLRGYSFFLNKGATRVHAFSAVPGSEADDTGLGLISQSFVDLAGQPDATYPDDDGPYTSPTLASLGRVAAIMGENLDPDPSPRHLALEEVAECHGGIQFRGDGTEARPDLFHRDVVAFLPFQRSAEAFVVHVYVMGRDLTQDLDPTRFELVISGLQGLSVDVRAVDPLLDTDVAADVLVRSDDSIRVALELTDYPRLVVLTGA